MNFDLSPPPTGSLSVVRFHGNEWEFQFPRLDNNVYEMFHAALEDYDMARFEEAERRLRLILVGFPDSGSG